MLEQIIILIILVCLSGFFSASESAIFSLPPAKLKVLEKKSANGKMLAKLKAQPQRLLITLLIGNNIVNIVASSMASILAYQYLGSLGPALAVFVITLAILIFGEIVPKSFAQTKIEKVALVVIPVIYALNIILYPVVSILEKLNKIFIGLFSSSRKEPTVSEEELYSLAEIGVEEGVVEHKEKEMIKRVLEFKDISADDVMTVRSRIFGLKAELKIKDAIPLLLDQKFTRVPIYDKSIDNITGVVFLSDIVKAIYENKVDQSLRVISHKAYFVPEQRKLDDIFKDFQRQRIHMAVVLDEQGLTSGVVTLEDLLEELVGQIMDESDVNEFMIKRLDKNTILVDADTEVKEIMNFINIDIKAKPQELISVVILEKIGRIPKPGEIIEFNGYVAVIEKATPKKIEKVRIIKNAK